MRKKFVRGLALVSAGLMAMGLLAGCNQKTNQETTSEAVSTEAETTPTEETLAPITDGNYPAEPGYMTVRGRYLAWNGVLWLSYSASGIEFDYSDCSTCTISLKGDSTASVESAADHQAKYAVYVNDELVETGMMDEAEKDLVLDLSETSGTVHFAKLSESSDSSIGITGVTVDGTISPVDEEDLAIEFIGDSITCGYGADGELGDTYRTENENALKTYAYKTAQNLDADYHMVSFSGYGILSGYTGDGNQNTASLMPLYYDKQGNSYGNILTGIKNGTLAWDFSLWQPDIVVINLGTNDASYCKDDEKKQEFADAYVEFLKTVRSDNPDAKIVGVLGLMGDDLYPQVEEAFASYTEETGDENVATLKLSVQDANNGYAVDYHPVEANHQIAADELTAFLQELGY